MKPPEKLMGSRVRTDTTKIKMWKSMSENVVMAIGIKRRLDSGH